MGTAAAGTALSLAVEVGQLFSGRSADLDDVMVNGLGALLGAVLSALLARVGSRRAEPVMEPQDERALSDPTPRSAGSP